MEVMGGIGIRGGGFSGTGAVGWDPTEVNIRIGNVSCVHPSTARGAASPLSTLGCGGRFCLPN